MTTICNCATCQEIKNKIKFRHPECPYCKERHDTRIRCIESMAYTKEFMLKNNLKLENGLIKKFKSKMAKRMYTSTYKKGGIVPKSTLKEDIQNNSEYFLDVADGKYSVYQERSGALKSLRHGEPWRNCSEDNLVFNLMVELIEAKEKIKKLEEKIEVINSNNW